MFPLLALTGYQWMGIGGIVFGLLYVEAARRADVPLAGVGLPGHYVVAHFGDAEPLSLDPFNGGVEVTSDAPAALVRPWSPHETAMRMLNNLVPAFQKHDDLTRALRAAELRLALPVEPDERDRVRAELVALRARFN